jgi:CBS domain-containing protein
MVPAEEAIRTLFHYENPYTVPNLVIFSCVYFIAMVLAYGISVPAGLFIPALLSGAGMGRIIGELLVIHLPEAADVNAGIYALVGAAAMLGGVTRMTISLAVILMETTGNVVFALPLISTLMTSRFVGNFFNEGIYDTHIELKGWPLLPDHVPKKLLRELRACDVMSKPPLVLRELETVGGALAALQRTTHNAFPVVYSEGMMRAHPRLGSLCGLITRRELSVLLTKKAFHGDLPSLPFDVVQPNPTRSTLSAFAINLSGVHMRPQAGTGGGLSTVGGETGRRFDAAAALLSVDDFEAASAGGGASGLRSGAAMQSFGSREGVVTASPYLGAVSSVAQPTRSLNSGVAQVAATGEVGDSGLSGASDFPDKREDGRSGSPADVVSVASKGRKAGSGMLSRWFGGGEKDSRSGADLAASATGLSSSPGKPSASRSVGLLSSSPAASSVRLRMPSVVDASFGGFNAGSSSALDRGTASLLEGYGHVVHRDLPDASASLLHPQQLHYGSGDRSPALVSSLSSSLRSPSRSGLASLAMLGELEAPGARIEGDFSLAGLEDVGSRSVRVQTLNRRLRRPSNIRISGREGEPSETIVVPAAPALLPPHGSNREAHAAAVNIHEAALASRLTSRTTLATLQASSPRGSNRLVDSTGFGASAGISRESSGLGGLSFPPHSDSVADPVGHSGGHSAASINPSPDHEHPVLAVSATPTAARFLPDAGVQASEAYRIHVALEGGAADGSAGVLHFEAQPDILELVYSTEPLLRSEDFDAYYPRYPDVADMSLSSEEASSYLDLRPYLNPTPFTVHLHAPVERAFEMFRSLGLRHLVVVNDSHDVVGIITRKDLLLHNLSQRKDEKRGRTERTRDVDVDTA